MSLELRLRPQAESDLTEAALWYEQQRHGLGHEFLDEVASAFASISESPKKYQLIHRRTRRVLIRRFPFGVYYRIESGAVVVIAVMHASRHPVRWMART